MYLFFCADLSLITEANHSFSHLPRLVRKGRKLCTANGKLFCRLLWNRLTPGQIQYIILKIQSLTKNKALENPINLEFLTLSPSVYFNRGSRNRTHIDGFGDRCSTFELCPYPRNPGTSFPRPLTDYNLSSCYLSTSFYRF